MLAWIVCASRAKTPLALAHSRARHINHNQNNQNQHQGLRKVLNYIQAEYNPKGGVVITENGVAVREDGVDDALKDIERAVYLKRYLTEVHKALVLDDVDVSFFAGAGGWRGVLEGCLGGF